VGVNSENAPKEHGWLGSLPYLILAALSFMGAALCVFLLKASAPQNADAPVLEILDAVSGKAYNMRPVDEGSEFAIEFVHSVNNSPIRETFTVEGRKIRPVSVRFYSFGAGMPSELEEGQRLSRDGDALVISGFNRAFTELNYIVGTVSDHLLFINGQAISLRNLCGKNAHITIRIK
jgi:hypothetical protein